MKINTTTGTYEQQVYVKETADNKKAELQDSQPVERGAESSKGGDTVSLSTTSKELQMAKSAATSAPEEKSSRVEEIKQSISQGTYEIKPEKIAEKILGTNISEYV